jgi:hypothetical protein
MMIQARQNFRERAKGERNISIVYNDKFIGQTRDISSCLPLYINEIPQVILGRVVDVKTFSIVHPATFPFQIL